MNSSLPFASRASLMTVLASTLLLTGCYTTGGHTPDKSRFPEAVPSGQLDFKKSDTTATPEMPVAQRLALSDAGAAKLYSFKAMGQSLRMTLAQFAQAYKLNVIVDQDVAGVVNVEFYDLPLERALDSILDPIGIGWVQEDETIRITRQVTHTYQIDYLRAVRTSTSAASSNSSSSGTGNERHQYCHHQQDRFGRFLERSGNRDQIADDQGNGRSRQRYQAAAGRKHHHDRCQGGDNHLLQSDSGSRGPGDDQPA